MLENEAGATAGVVLAAALKFQFVPAGTIGFWSGQISGINLSKSVFPKMLNVLEASTSRSPRANI